MEFKKFAGGNGKTMIGQLIAGEDAMRESRKVNAGDTMHQVSIGKSRDGMSVFAKSHSTNSGASLATGLLAGLLRRI